jgi:hypothetical protein
LAAVVLPDAGAPESVMMIADHPFLGLLKASLINMACAETL